MTEKPCKQLLIVYHSQSGRTEVLAQAVYRGACRETGIQSRLLRAFDATTEDLLACDGAIFGTPENFGYMSGALKDFYDRTYDAWHAVAVERGLLLPCALFISAGNDGSGAVREIKRILAGYPMRTVADDIIVKGEPTADDLLQCEELGQMMAAGVEMGIF